MDSLIRQNGGLGVVISVPLGRIKFDPPIGQKCPKVSFRQKSIKSLLLKYERKSSEVNFDHVALHHFSVEQLNPNLD